MNIIVMHPQQLPASYRMCLVWFEFYSFFSCLKKGTEKTVPNQFESKRETEKSV